MNRQEYYKLAMMHAPAAPADFSAPVIKEKIVEGDGITVVRARYLERSSNAIEREVAWRKKYALALVNAAFEGEYP